MQLQAQETWSLKQCVEYAMENNLSIKQSDLRAQIAHHNQTQAKLNLLPTLNGSATHGYNWGQTIDPFTNQFATTRVRTNSLGVQSQLTLFNGFQRINQIKKSNYDFMASVADADRVKNDVALNIANAYVSVLFAQDLLEIAENQLEISRLQRERVSQLVITGNLPKSNRLDAEAQEALDEATLVQRENDLQLAYLSLYQILQLDPSQSILVEEPEMLEVSSSFLTEKPSGIYEMAVEDLPQIKAAKYRVKSAEKNLDIAQGGTLPRLTASGSYGSGYSGNNRILRDGAVPDDSSQVSLGFVQGQEIVLSQPQFGDEDFKTKEFGDQLTDNLNQSLSFSLVVPLFNGYSSRTAVKQAKLNAAISNYDLQLAKNTLKQDIQRAYADAKAALKSFEAAKKSKAAAEEAFKYADIRYTQNLINQVEYSDAKVRLANAQLEQSRSKYDFIFKVKVLEFYKGQNISF